MFNIMGNQRQVLKDNIEKELMSKIRVANDVIEQLNKNVDLSKQNCQNAKEEVEEASYLLQNAITERKAELIRQVDTLHNSQMKPLQDAIQSTWVTMGQLQGMLSNLNSFDQGQLVNIRIPDVDMSLTSEPSQIRLQTPCENLHKDVREWGTMTLDNNSNSTFITDIQEDFAHPSNSCIGCPRTAPTAFGDETNLSDIEDIDFDLLDDEVSGSSIVCIGKCPRKVQEKQQRQEFYQPPEDISLWLKHKKITPEETCNDQEIPVPKNLSLMKRTSSICSSRSDFSSSSTMSNTEKKPSISSSSSSSANSTTLNVTKRILNFPCLEMDADNWVRKKKTKSTDVAPSIVPSVSPTSLISPSSSVASVPSCPAKNTNLFLQNQQKQNFISPAYALPNPFWLKKYQVRR